jgi:hypothetical protein
MEAAMADEEEGKGSDRLIEHVGVVDGEYADITVDVCAWTDDKGKVYPASLRVRRVKADRRRPLGSIRTPEEAEGLAKLLKKAAGALARALGQEA